MKYTLITLNELENINEAMAEADGLMTGEEWDSFIESFNRWLDEVDCYAYEDRYEYA